MNRQARRDEFAKDVALMRELGVLKWGTVVVGPPVAAVVAAKEPSAEQRRAHELDAEQRRHNILFAASTMKPRLRPPQEQQAAEDAARLSRVANGESNSVQRVNSPEHAGGTKKRTA